MTPLAIDGAAPRITTNRIALSSAKSRIASGNQAIDGIVCRPVIIEPMPARSTRLRATSDADDGADRGRDARTR